jgi:alpha-tubulin suppressor-like RCC1 family protein
MKKVNAAIGGIVLSLGFTACADPPVVAGGRQTCVTDDGRVRCWGAGQFGVLGYGNTNNIGDNEHPATAGDVPVGGEVEHLALGYYHTCALLDTGRVRCWGRNDNGQLGLGHTNNIGDNEPASAGGVVSLGGTATQIAAGTYHTCALLTSGQVRCWGDGQFGQLGYGNTNDIGDNELPFSAGVVSVGGTVTQIAAGSFHTCALLTTGSVRCWGSNWAGALGVGHTATIGDNELPSSVATITLGFVPTALAAGESHTCALADGRVKCWGYAAYGQLGYANENNIGDTELPSAVGFVNVGADALTLTAGGNQTCVLTDDYDVRCWGEGLWGPLGYGNQQDIGDNEHPAAAGTVSLGGDVISVSAGYDHTCAVISSAEYLVRCWGHNPAGVLGRGVLGDVGDNELPSAVSPVVVE